MFRKHPWQYTPKQREAKNAIENEARKQGILPAKSTPDELDFLLREWDKDRTRFQSLHEVLEDYEAVSTDNKSVTQPAFPRSQSDPTLVSSRVAQNILRNSPKSASPSFTNQNIGHDKDEKKQILKEQKKAVPILIPKLPLKEYSNLLKNNLKKKISSHRFQKKCVENFILLLNDCKEDLSDSPSIKPLMEQIPLLDIHRSASFLLAEKLITNIELAEFNKKLLRYSYEHEPVLAPIDNIEHISFREEARRNDERQFRTTLLSIYDNIFREPWALHNKGGEEIYGPNGKTHKVPKNVALIAREIESALIGKRSFANAALWIKNIVAEAIEHPPLFGKRDPTTTAFYRQIQSKIDTKAAKINFSPRTR
jgi:hypothetical protein